MLHVFSLLLVLSLSPERTVAPQNHDRASAEDSFAATNGRSQLVAWKAWDHHAVYARLIDGPISPAPNAVLLGRADAAPAGIGGVASDGDGYVVVWNDGKRLLTSHVSASGESEWPRVVAVAEGTFATTANSVIASNGRGYLVLWNDRIRVGSTDNIRTFARMLDRAGAPVGEPSLLIDFGPGFSLPIRLASDGNGYLAELWGRLIPISGEGVVGTTQRAPYAVTSLGFDGTTYLLFMARPSVARLDRDGRIVGPEQTFANGPLSTDDFAVTQQASNGNGTLAIVTREGTGRPAYAMRFAPGGMPLDIAWRPLPMSLYPRKIAPAPGGDYLLYSYVSGARVPASLDIPANARMEEIARTPVPQTRARVATVGGSPLAVWHESIRVFANGAQVTDFSYSTEVGSDGTRALIAWFNVDSRDPVAYVHGRYVDAAGRMSEPFVIARLDRLVTLTDVVAVDGGFVVVWQEDHPEASGGLHRAKVGGNDAPLPFNLTTYDGARTLHRDGAVARTANGFLLVYQELVSPSRNAIRAAPFRADLGHAGPMMTIADTIDAESHPDVAGDGAGRLLAVWSAVPSSGAPAEIRATLLAEDGSPIGRELVLGPGTAPRVSWTGSFFAIAAGSGIGAVSCDGEVLQPIAPMLGNVQNPFIGGRVLAYTKDEQVMVRTIGDLRRRSAR